MGAALLAGSWLFGLDYFYPANNWAWFALLAGGAALLSRVEIPSEDSQRNATYLTIALLLPVAWYAAWPLKAAPLLILLGLAIGLLPARRRWSDGLARGAVVSGVVLFVQAVVLAAYADGTARSHELPWPLPDLLASAASLLGIDAAADGSSVVMHSMRQVHRLGATWELLLDPATVLFLAGGATLLALSQPRWSAWIGALRALCIAVVCWLPLRAGLMMAVYLQRVLRSDPDRPLHAMNHLFSPWVLLALLIVPVLLAWRFVRVEPSEESTPSDIPPSALRLPPYAWIALAVVLWTTAVEWNPVGSRREGRVMGVERHSTWEPTTAGYNTAEFGELSGYNYSAIYDYLGQYYKMSRLMEQDKIDKETLDRCDVLIIKNPSTRYSPAEVKAVQQFVREGGGLLLVGDHTNFEGSGTIFNDITRPMGFTFRDDLLFGFGESPYEQSYVPRRPAHPIVQHLESMDFAVSCSIDPGNSPGRAAAANTGLWSMGPEYHYDNYHPFPQHCPEMRYGAFVQVWSAGFGRGRTVAFTDSTIFSNFCVFQPGKAELMRGMVEWLNHKAPPLDPRPWLLLLGCAPLAVGFWSGFGLPSPFGRGAGGEGRWLLVLACGACAWAVASMAVGAAQRWAMPVPERINPQRRVVIDRALSQVPLSKGAYTQGEGNGYGLFEQWIARLGGHTVRQSDLTEIFSGDALVVICPNRAVTTEYRDALERYVAEGGRLLVVDSPENNGSTANSLLWPFGLSMHLDRAWQGKLVTTDLLPAVEVARAREVAGGQALAWLGEYPVAAATRHGKGLVVAVGFGSLWNDAGMGETWMLEPEAAVKDRFDVLFALLRYFLEDKPLPTSPPKPAAKELPAEMPVEESSTSG